MHLNAHGTLTGTVIAPPKGVPLCEISEGVSVWRFHCLVDDVSLRDHEWPWYVERDYAVCFFTVPESREFVLQPDDRVELSGRLQSFQRGPDEPWLIMLVVETAQRLNHEDEPVTSSVEGEA